MTFDESNARITQELTGREFDHFYRKGKEFHIVCTDGHSVVLQADVNGEIHYLRTDVTIMLTGVEFMADAGKIG